MSRCRERTSGLRRSYQRGRQYEDQIAGLQQDLDRAREFAQQITEMTGGGKSACIAGAARPFLSAL